ncbi:MAG: TonB-dependent receptor [Siculibacillus sp.]|nr:TonB-dependent receptor [Siculibacillus sp.]
MNTVRHMGSAGLLTLTVVLTASPVLAQQSPSATLPEVVVTAEGAAAGSGAEKTTAGPVKGWQALTAGSATNTETPLRAIPRSVQVLPKKAIEDQGAVSQAEALQNVSGVQALNPLFAGQISPRVRGFSGEHFIDGLPNYYDNGARDLLANVERIEVSKGPGSILHQGGQGPIGGIVNVVSKLPTPQASHQIGTTFGTNGLISPWFDVNMPMSKDGSVLFRVTGQYERTGVAGIDTLDRRSYELDPTLVFGNGGDTKLTLQARLSHREQQDYTGLPAVGTLDQSLFSIRRSLFPSDPNLPKSETSYQGLTARLDQTFDETWSAFVTARASRSNFREYSQLLMGQAPFLGSFFGVFNGYLGEDNHEVTVSANLLGKFDWGVTRNRLLLSADINRVGDRGRLDADLAGLVDFTNPIFPGYVQPVPGLFTTFSNIDNVYVQRGLTAQWQSDVWDRLHLLAALKLANVDIRSNELTTGASFHTDETKVLPRLGAAYDVVDGLTVFASYSEGLRAVPFFNGPTAPKPEGSKQYEAGLKLELARGLAATFAVFDLERNNVPTANPLVPGQQIQTAVQRSRGVEIDATWQPSPNWSFLASYAHVNATYEKDTTIPAGNLIEGVPADSARLWGTYRFTDDALKGLSLGAGLYAASRTALTSANTHFTGGYTTFDARIGYEKDNWSVALTAKNLTDRDHWVRYPYLDGRVAPGEGRALYASFTAKF